MSSHQGGLHALKRLLKMGSLASLLMVILSSVVMATPATTNSDLEIMGKAKQGIVQPSFGLSPESSLREGVMTIQGENIFVELALDGPSQAQGLMFREAMPENRGMLFMFEREEPLAFWMRNTLIPLDIIYIDETGKVVHIVTAEPCKTKQCPTYPSVLPAKYVLELNAGEAERRGLKEGDNLSWEW